MKTRYPITCFDQPLVQPIHDSILSRRMIPALNWKQAQKNHNPRFPRQNATPPSAKLANKSKLIPPTTLLLFLRLMFAIPARSRNHHTSFLHRPVRQPTAPAQYTNERIVTVRDQLETDPAIGRKLLTLHSGNGDMDLPWHNSGCDASYVGVTNGAGVQ